MLTQPEKGTPKKTYDDFGEKSLLTNAFAPKAIIYTYTGGQHVTVKNVLRFDIACQEVSNKHPRKLRKIDVLFAIKDDTLRTVKDGIRIDTDVQARNLRTPEKRADRPTVLTPENLTRGLNRDVRLVMRSGHVLRGWLLRVSRYNIVLNIGGALVLVYRHGVLQYSVIPQQGGSG